MTLAPAERFVFSISSPLESKLLGIQRHGRIGGDVDPDVDVRLAAEVPDKRRAFQSPVVPFAVVTDVAFLVEGQAAFIDAALLLQAVLDLVLILFAIWIEQAQEDLLYAFF